MLDSSSRPRFAQNIPKWHTEAVRKPKLAPLPEMRGGFVGDHAKTSAPFASTRIALIDTWRCLLSRSRPKKSSVLIVDSSDEVREVLRTILAQRGIRIFEAEQPEKGLEILKRQHPSVVILDLEIDSANRLHDAFQRESQRGHADLVVLGRIRGIDYQGEQVITKPYHFGPLIRTIEQLLQVEPTGTQPSQVPDLNPPA